MDPEMALGHSSGLGVSMALGGSTGHKYLYGLGSMTLLSQHGLKCLTRLQASVQPSVVTGAKETSTDFGCGRAMDPDIDPGSSPGLTSPWPWWQAGLPHYLLLLRSVFLYRT